MGLQILQAIADPSKDLDYPYKGPFNSERDGDFEIASLSLSLCKKARLWNSSKILAGTLIYQNPSRQLPQLLFPGSLTINL